MTETNKPGPNLKPARKVEEKLALPSSSKTAILRAVPSLHLIALGDTIAELSDELRTDL